MRVNVVLCCFYYFSRITLTKKIGNMNNKFDIKFFFPKSESAFWYEKQKITRKMALSYRFSWKSVCYCTTPSDVWNLISFQSMNFDLFCVVKICMKSQMSTSRVDSRATFVHRREKKMFSWANYNSPFPHKNHVIMCHCHHLTSEMIVLFMKREHCPKHQKNYFFLFNERIWIFVRL